MEEELNKNERKGQGTFYMIVAMLTLVVAMVGATFAYFSLQASNNDAIKGSAAKVGLSLEVTRLSDEASGDLVPLKKELLTNAVAGDIATDNKMCVDKDGNTVCQIYELKVSNQGKAVINVNGTLTLTNEGITNLKWQLMTDSSTPKTDEESFFTKEDTSIISGDNIPAGTGEELDFTPGTKSYYIMIWIDDTLEDQNKTDVGGFTGVVNFTSSNGSGVTGTFTMGG